MTQQIQWTKPVCQLDSDGLYLHQTMADLDYYTKDGSYIIPGGCVDTAPPETREGHAARWNGSGWEYLPDLRGQTAYRTADGEAVLIETVGALSDGLTLTPRPSEAYEWGGKKWKENKTRAAEIRAAALAESKAEKLRSLNHATQNFVNHVSGADQLPEFEVQTWTLQALEAKAWAADKSAATPTLDTIAAARDIPPEVLKQKALEKALKFEALTARVVGMRQAWETQIRTAADIDAVRGIEFDFSGVLEQRND